MSTWGRRWSPESADAIRKRRTGAGAPDAAQRGSYAPAGIDAHSFGGTFSRHLDAEIAKRPAMLAAAKPATSGKVGGVITYVDGHRFPSKLEARLYTRLTVLLAEARIVAFLRQVPLHLPGGRKLVVDFLVQTHSPTRPVRILDSKGYTTDRAALAISVAEATYPWPIELIRGRHADTWEPEAEPIQVSTTRARTRAKGGGGG